MAQLLPSVSLMLVFGTGASSEVDRITEKLQNGNRMGKQSMIAVIRLKQGDVFAPQKVGFFPATSIDFNRTAFDELANVAKILARAY